LDGQEFCLDTHTVREELGEVPLSHPSVREWLREFITQEEEMLACSARDVSAV
jgi:hypothetical protein